jgi:hypothetical protein
VPSVARQAISEIVSRQHEQQPVKARYRIDDPQIRPGLVTIVGRVE